MNNPYQVIKGRRVTEKSRVLENLQHATSNRSVSRCKSPKAVFDVHPSANKTQIAKAIELIYADKQKQVKVVSVNTVNIRPKQRRVRGHVGMTAASKKAIVTFRPGDVIDEQV